MHHAIVNVYKKMKKIIVIEGEKRVKIHISKKNMTASSPLVLIFVFFLISCDDSEPTWTAYTACTISHMMRSQLKHWLSQNMIGICRK